MTTAIEQAKREMYGFFNTVKRHVGEGRLPIMSLDVFETHLETYLEQLRQQYEEMASTAHQRFESIQSLESVNQELDARLSTMTSNRDDAIHNYRSMTQELAKMTESRDMFRNLHQAATHASIGRVGQGSNPVKLQEIAPPASSQTPRRW